MSRQNAPLPKIAKQRLNLFSLYVRWFLQRNFHSLHLLRLSDLEGLKGFPLLICLNHPSWWDPLIGLHLSQRFFPDRYNVAPIAAQGLAKYKFFERLGFFSISSESIQGAARFLEIGKTVLRRPDGALWVTPQGAFSDARVPIAVERGCGHLVRHIDRFAMLPVALEYSFWNERFPEAFSCFGVPVIGTGSDHSPQGWNNLFARSMQQTLDALSARVKARDSGVFQPLLEGNAGVGGIYDLWRASKAKLQGEVWQPGHGEH